MRQPGSGRSGKMAGLMVDRAPGRGERCGSHSPRRLLTSPRRQETPGQVPPRGPALPASAAHFRVPALRGARREAESQPPPPVRLPPPAEGKGGSDPRTPWGCPRAGPGPAPARPVRGGARRRRDESAGGAEVSYGAQPRQRGRAGGGCHRPGEAGLTLSALAWVCPAAPQRLPLSMGRWVSLWVPGPPRPLSAGGGEVPASPRRWREARGSAVAEPGVEPASRGPGVLGSPEAPAESCPLGPPRPLSGRDWRDGAGSWEDEERFLGRCARCGLPFLGVGEASVGRAGKRLV